MDLAAHAVRRLTSGGYIGAHLSISRGNLVVKSVFEWLALLMGTSLLIRSSDLWHQVPWPLIRASSETDWTIASPTPPLQPRGPGR